MYTLEPEDINRVENVSQYLLPEEERRQLTCQWVGGLVVGLVLTCLPVAIPRPPSKVMGVKIPAIPIQRTLQGSCFGFAVLSMGISISGINKLLRCAPYVNTVRVMNAQRFSDSYGVVMKAHLDADERAWLPYLHQKQPEYLPAATVEPKLEEPPAGQDPLGLIAALAEYGVLATWDRQIDGPSFIRCLIHPSRGTRFASVVKLSEDIQRSLGLPLAPFISQSGHAIAIDIPRTLRQTLLFSQKISFNPQVIEPIQIAVGVNLDGELIYASLSDTDTCHILVGGTTGSGKTEFLKSAIASLIWRYSPDKVQLIIVDPKRTKYNDFAKIPWLYCPIVKDVEGAIDVMTEMVEEMSNRYQLFESNDCENIDGYLKETDQSLPHIIVIYDEFADFMGDKEDKAAIELSAKRLGQKAREAGIHLILATQRPDKDVVTPILRSNLPGRIALRVKSEGDSNIILGEGENAHHLLGKGDLLYQTSGGTVRLQSLFLDDVSCLKNSHTTKRATEITTGNETGNTVGNGAGNATGNAPVTNGYSDSNQKPWSDVTRLQEAVTKMRKEGKSRSWVIKKILLAVGRNFPAGQLALDKYLAEIDEDKKSDPSPRNSKLEQLKELLSTESERTQIIRQLWGEIRVDSHKDAEAMLDAMLVEICSEVSRESILRILPSKDWESRQWVSQLPGTYLIFSADYSRLFYVGRTEGKTSVNLRINSNKYPHHKLPNIQQALSAGIEILIGWITCLDDTQRITCEDKLIEAWSPEWNNKN